MTGKALCVLIWCLLGLVEVIPACSCIEVEVKGNHKKAFEKWLKGFKGSIFTGEVSKIEEVKIPISDDPSGTHATIFSAQ